MNCRRQALQFCLDPAVVVVIQICNEFLLEVFHGVELLQIQQLTFEQPEEIFYLLQMIVILIITKVCSIGRRRNRGNICSRFFRIISGTQREERFPHDKTWPQFERIATTLVVIVQKTKNLY